MVQVRLLIGFVGYSFEKSSRLCCLLHLSSYVRFVCHTILSQTSIFHVFQLRRSPQHYANVTVSALFGNHLYLQQLGLSHNRQWGAVRWLDK